METGFRGAMNGQNGRQPKYPFMHISELRESDNGYPSR